MATSQKKKQTELNQQLREELSRLDSRQHEAAIRQKYEEYKQRQERVSQSEMISKDKEIIRQLDQLVEEQQSVLEQASVLSFFVTTDKESIKLQMGVLEVVQRVGIELGLCNSCI